MKSIASAGALYACLVLVACAQDQMKRFVGATVLAVVWVVAAHAADRAGLPDASKTPGSSGKTSPSTRYATRNGAQILAPSLPR